MTENVYKSNKHQFFFELTDLSLRMILRIFIIFCESEPRDSYKNNSYKKKCVVYSRDFKKNKNGEYEHL